MSSTGTTLSPWISKNDGSGQIVLDLAPSPDPVPKFKRHGSFKKFVSGWGSGGVTPGGTLSWDGGVTVGDGTLEMETEYATYTTMAALQALFFAVPAKTVWYSPNGATYGTSSTGQIWELAWAEGDSFDPAVIPGLGAQPGGTPDAYKIRMKFRVIRQVQ